MADDLTNMRTAIRDVVVAQYEPVLAAALEATRAQHERMIEAAVDAAVAAVQSGVSAPTVAPAPQPRSPRKPRADKGHKRMGKGLPASDPSPDMSADVAPSEPACAECDHFQSLHQDGTGECGIHRCDCPTFISQS